MKLGGVKVSLRKLNSMLSVICRTCEPSHTVAREVITLPLKQKEKKRNEGGEGQKKEGSK